MRIGKPSLFNQNQEPRTKNQEPRTRNQEPRTKTMKPIHKALALSAMIALPAGIATAAQLSIKPGSPSEIKAEENETKTVNLKITGMT